VSRAELPATVRERRAVVYVRQSTSTQVQENLESQRRQYALADLARDYGFRNVLTIDDDLGRSASGAVERPGFDALVAQLCQGAVGAVFCLEASRLARNGREWHHLLELCALVGARVVDADGVYDPAVPNDRLLLGLKGTISEFELTLMRRRLLEGAQAKARRGEYRIAVPVGYLWSRETGALEMDPDRRVQEAIRTVFRLFDRFLSARQVHLHMGREGLRIPRPSDGKRAASRRWLAPAYRNVLSVLQNPCYAGAYAYGRTTHRTTFVEGRLAKTYGHPQPRDAWGVLLREHHAGYITWADFERNQVRLQRNAHRAVAGGAKAGRGGAALLSGLLRCRRCGRMLFVVYTGHAPRRHPRYVCRRGQVVHGAHSCVAFGASRPDDVVATEVVRAVAPDAVEAAIAAMNLTHERHAERRRALELEREQARYEAGLAERRYEAVDPDNRLVATELEARWNAALARLRDCEQRLAELAPRADDVPDRDALLRLASDLRAAWDAPTADAAVKQRLVRALIEEIVVDVDEATREIVLAIHWRGGVHSELRARRPASGEHRKRASATADALIRAQAGIDSDADIASALNRLGERTGQGLPWTSGRVVSYRRTIGLPAYGPARRDGTSLTMRDAAAALGVPDTVIRNLIQRGVLPAHQVMPDAPWQIRAVDLETEAVREAIRTRRVCRRAHGGGAVKSDPALENKRKR
jgi:DNA invertase Pin-like site-specific DNA recombinase